MENIQEEIKVLFHAALLGRTDVVKNAITALKSAGLTDEQICKEISTQREDDAATPLHVASKAGHTDVIRALLNAGAILDIKGNREEFAQLTPYQVAIEAAQQAYHVYLFEQIAMGNAIKIRQLINGGVPAFIYDNSMTNDSTLHWACSFGNYVVAEVLIEFGCEINVTNQDLQTPLHAACKGGHYQLCELLLLEGADVNVVDKHGNQPKNYLQPTMKEFSALEALFMNPPTPTFAIRNKYLEMIEMASKLTESQIVTSTSSPERASIEKYLGIFDGCSPTSPTSNIDCDDSLPLLVFWPPVKSQTRRRKNKPLILNSMQNINICVSSANVDVFPLLNCSGLLDTMDLFGFQIHVKRSSKDSLIKMSIDKSICPKQESYQMQVTSELVTITAGDASGLLFGTYTFMQLLQLHSEIIHQDGITTVSVPSISIYDYPEITTRAVMWSYRNKTQTNIHKMIANVELLSKIRINTLYLVVDSIDKYMQFHVEKSPDELKVKKNGDTTTQQVCQEPDPASNGADTSPKQSDSHRFDSESVANLYALDETCRKYNQDLIPTVILTSIYQSLNTEALRNFSNTTIALLFLYEFDPHYHFEGEMSAPERSQNCIRAFERILCEVQLAGYRSVILSYSNTTKQYLQGLAMSAIKNGLNVVERNVMLMYPSSLFTKPLVSTQSFIGSIYKYTQYDADVSVFPAFMDSDFMAPSLLLQFYCFMSAGYAWNRNTLLDMIGDPLDETGNFDATILKEVITLLLFPQKGDISNTAFNTILTILLGNFVEKDRIAHVPSHELQNGSLLTSDTVFMSPSENVGLKLNETAKAEKMLWTLTSLRDVNDLNMLISKLEASYCLKLYKKILNSANWKPNGKLKYHDIDERDMTPFSSPVPKSHPPTTFNNSTLNRKNGINMNDSFKSRNGSTSNKPHLNSATLSPMQQEVEEYFACIHMLSVISKAIVMAYHSYHRKYPMEMEKKTAERITRLESMPIKMEKKSELFEVVNSFQSIFTTLPAGTKSDIANSILESLNNCSGLWKFRFDGKVLEHLHVRSNQLGSYSSDTKESVTFNQWLRTEIHSILSNQQQLDASLVDLGMKSALEMYSVWESNKRFLLQDQPTIPCGALFKVITSSLPLPHSVQEFIDRLFI